MYIFHIVYSISNSTRIFYWFLYFFAKCFVEFLAFSHSNWNHSISNICNEWNCIIQTTDNNKKKNKIENSKKIQIEPKPKHLYAWNFQKTTQNHRLRFLFWRHRVLAHLYFSCCVSVTAVKYHVSTKNLDRSTDRPTNQPCSLPCCIACDNDFDWNTRKRFDIHK